MTDRALKAQLDERRVAKGVAMALPLATLVIALGAGAVLGAPIAILVLGAGMLLGVVALLWASLRVLTGDAALPPEIEALDRTAVGVDLLASRKKMMLLALKDLEAEHALGKLDAEDFEQISATYRSELKVVLQEIDATLEPFRGKALATAKAHLEKESIVSKEPDDADDSEPAVSKATSLPKAATLEAVAARLPCPKCESSNEPDAKFCKSCGTTLEIVHEG